MTKPILYSLRQCPYAIRARLGLLLAEQDVEIRDISLKDKHRQLGLCREQRMPGSPRRRYRPLGSWR